MRSVSFDVDGTLINNQSYVREAYELAGVKMSDEQWSRRFGKTFSEWLVEWCGGDYQLAWDVHKQKNRHYHDIMARLTPTSDVVLTPTMLAHELIINRHDVYIVTGASNVAAVSVLHFLGLESLHPTNTTAALSAEGKIARVIDLNAVHIDDDERIVEGLLDQGYPYVIHYKIGDALRDLREAVEYMWTP